MGNEKLFRPKKGVPIGRKDGEYIMNVLNKLTKKNLLLNKKRTIVTIIGIMLSTALVCAVAGLVTSAQQTFVNLIKNSDGDYHISFSNVPQDSKNILR